MIQATYTNKYGQSLTFGKSPPFFLYGIDANSLATSSGTNKAVGQHGQSTQAITYQPRTIVLGCGFNGVSGGRMDWKLMRKHWAEICKVFIPDQNGTLTYKNDGGVYQIECRPLEIPDFTKLVGTYNKFSLDMLADNPFWLSQFLFNNRLGHVIGGARYPRRFPFRFGTWVKDAYVVNDTNIPTPVEVEITSTAKYVTITNQTTGEFLKVDIPIESNQKMIVNTEDCTVKLITLDVAGEILAEEYANYKLDLNSRYFHLIPGENHITIDNGYPDTTASAVIRYRKHYLGV